MLYNTVVSELDSWKFEQKLNDEITKMSSSNYDLRDIHFSTCPAVVLSFASSDTIAEDYSVTRYTALLTFVRR